MVDAALSAALDVGPLPSQPTRRARARDRLLLSLWLLGGLYASIAIVGWHTALGYDARAYWLAWHHSPMYGLPPNTADAYLYSPAFAQALWPLAQLPWPLFLAAWAVAGFAVYAWLLRPLGWSLAAPLLVFCLPQAMVGNIWPLLAVVLVFGFRHPGLWALSLLTKVTAGVGVVWFAARGEWRDLARLLVPTALVTAVSVAISPQLWADWLHILAGGGTGGDAAGGYDLPLGYRLPVAFALAVYAGRRSRPGILAASLALACPVFALSYLMSNAFLLTALPRLREMHTHTDRADVPRPTLLQRQHSLAAAVAED
jgi:Glycosyltransferase family 87